MPLSLVDLIIVFTGLWNKSIRQLQLIQHSAAQLHTKTKKLEHITPVLRVLFTLNLLNQRINFKLLVTSEALNGLGTKCLFNMVLCYEPPRSSGAGFAHRHQGQNQTCKSRFQIFMIWNKLLEHQHLSSFKSRLKMFLFSFFWCQDVTLLYFFF